MKNKHHKMQQRERENLHSCLVKSKKNKIISLISAMIKDDKYYDKSCYVKNLMVRN